MAVAWPACILAQAQCAAWPPLPRPGRNELALCGAVRGATGRPWDRAGPIEACSPAPTPAVPVLQGLQGAAPPPGGPLPALPWPPPHPLCGSGGFRLAVFVSFPGKGGLVAGGGVTESTEWVLASGPCAQAGLGVHASGSGIIWGPDSRWDRLWVHRQRRVGESLKPRRLLAEFCFLGLRP